MDIDKKALLEAVITHLNKHKPQNMGLYTYLSKKENEVKNVDMIHDVYKSIDPKHANLETAFKLLLKIQKVARKKLLD